MINRWDELERMPWEQAPDETDAAFRAFVAYRDMGRKRTLRLAADEVYAEHSGTDETHRRLVAKWSSPNRWVARCGEYDAFNDFTRWRERQDDIRLMERRHANTAVMLQKVALERLELLPASSMGARDVVSFLKEGVMMERLARGEATDRTELGGTEGRPIELSAVPASQLVRERLEIMQRNREEVQALTENLDDDE